jgi:hypothetical protein
MHANVKYVVDLTKTRDEAINDKKFDIRHIYKDQLNIKYDTQYFPQVNTIAYSFNDSSMNYTADISQGITLYKLSNGRYLLDLYETYVDESVRNLIVELGDADPHGLNSPYRYQYASVTDNVVTLEIPYPYYNILDIPKNVINAVHQTYVFSISHKTSMKFPATIWVDGIRLSNDNYYITTSAFSTKINIDASIITNENKYIEIEIYKMKDVNAKETVLTLPDIHNSIHLDVNDVYNAWDDISPQHLMVAVAQDTSDDQGQTRVRYLVTSSYES